MTDPTTSRDWHTVIERAIDEHRIMSGQPRYFCECGQWNRSHDDDDAAELFDAHRAQAVLDALTAAGWPTTHQPNRPHVQAAREARAEVERLRRTVELLTANAIDTIATADRERDEARRHLDLTEQERANARQALDEARAEVERLRSRVADLTETIDAYRLALDPRERETAGDAVLRVAAERDAERERADGLARDHETQRELTQLAEHDLTQLRTGIETLKAHATQERAGWDADAQHPNSIPAAVLTDIIDRLGFLLDCPAPAPSATEPDGDYATLRHAVEVFARYFRPESAPAEDLRALLADPARFIAIHDEDDEDDPPSSPTADQPAPVCTCPWGQDPTRPPKNHHRNCPTLRDPHGPEDGCPESGHVDWSTPDPAQVRMDDLLLEAGVEAPEWFPVACEHGFDRCPTCDAGTAPAPVHMGPASVAPPPDLGDDPDGDNTTEEADR